MRQRIVGLHGRMTRRRGGNPAQRVAGFPAAISPSRSSASARSGHDRFITSENRRDSRQPERFAAEIIDAESQPIEIGGMAQQRLPALRRQLNQQRFEQPLALERPALSRSMTRSNNTRSCATCWSMMAMPSASIAMMNVSRNCPSGISGLSGSEVLGVWVLGSDVSGSRARTHLAHVLRHPRLRSVRYPAARKDAAAQNTGNRLRSWHRIAIARRHQLQFRHRRPFQWRRRSRALRLRG